MAEQNYQPERIKPVVDIEALKARVEQLEAQLKKEEPPITPETEEKAVRQEIKDYLQGLQHAPSTIAPLATRDEAKEIDKFPPNQQVGALIALVFEKGLEQAISVARELNSPAILDEFHDTLVDRYYKELIEQKILKS